MKLTYEYVHKVGPEEAKVEVNADELPYNLLRRLGIADPGMSTVDVYFWMSISRTNAQYIGGGMHSHDAFAKILGDECTFVFADKAVKADVDEFFNRQALEHDIADCTEELAYA